MKPTTWESDDGSIRLVGFEQDHPVVDPPRSIAPGQGLLLELAFMIDDPCGDSELQLAGALIQFGRAVPESDRARAAKLLAELAEREGWKR